MTYSRFLIGALAILISSGSQPVLAASFSGSFPSYTFTTVCDDPPGSSIIFGITECVAVNIAYSATGTSSIFANASLTLATVLDPALPGPFPFAGTFLLENLDDPSSTLFGSLKGFGMIAGLPGPPVGFPPFTIEALLITTGGTGAYVGASGASRLTGTALFTFLNEDGTFASGEGAIDVDAVPEPATLLLAGLASLSLIRVSRARRNRLNTQTRNTTNP